MKTTWALQDAKNRFSEVVEKTLSEGPQEVTRRGVPVVVILPAKMYAEQTTPQASFVSFFRNSPLRGAALDLSRSKDTGRKIVL